MKIWNWTFLFFFMSAVSAAEVDIARLQIETREGRWNFSAPLELLEPLADPLLCRRAVNKLESLQRVDRQLSALLDKMIKNPSKFSAADWAEKENLESRRQENYDFLIQPSPPLRATWSLDDLNDETVQLLYLGAVDFSLDSFALIWEGNGEVIAFPEEFGDIWVSKVERTLTLVLRGKLIEFCSRGETQLRISGP